MNREINIQLNQLSQQQKEDKIKSFLKENKIEVVKKIGEGCFAEVFEAIKIDQNMRVAIKKLKDLKYLKKFQEEKLAMKKIQNLQFAIQLIGELENKELGYYAIIMEFCESDLTQIFEKNKDSCTYEQLLALAYQLLKGLQVFQEKGIIHGDLKPDNILYSQIKNKFLICKQINCQTSILNLLNQKIADLGLSQIMTKPELQQIISKQSQYSNMGNLKYMAPEVAKDQKPFTIKIDVFSVGQILLEFILKKQINLMEHMNLKQKKLLDVFPLLSSHQYNKFVKQLLEKMVCPDQNDRYEAMKLLQILSQFEFDEQSLKSLDFTNKNKIFKLNNQSNFEQNIAMQDQTFKNHISFKQAIELSDIKLKESKKKQKTISITKQNLMDTIDFQSYERANLDFRGESSQKYFLYFYNFNAVKAIQKVQDQKNITDMLLDLKQINIIFFHEIY